MKQTITRAFRALTRTGRRAALRISNTIMHTTNATTPAAAALAEIEARAIALEASKDRLAKLKERHAQAVTTANGLKQPTDPFETPENAVERNSKRLAASSYVDELAGQVSAIAREIDGQERGIRNSLAEIGRMIHDGIAKTRAEFLDDEIDRLLAGVDPIFKKASNSMTFDRLRIGATEIAYCAPRFRQLGEALEVAHVQVSDAITVETLIERAKAAVALAAQIEEPLSPSAS